MSDLEALRSQRQRLQQLKHRIMASLADAVVHHKSTERYYRNAYGQLNDTLLAVELQIAAYEPQESLFADL
jgi:hypothetical protein